MSGITFTTVSLSQVNTAGPGPGDPTPITWGKVPTCARRVDVSERTVWGWIAQGLPHVKVSGTTLIKFSDLDGWLQRHRVERNEVKRVVDDIMEKLKGRGL